jgi:hypothetical protein
MAEWRNDIDRVKPKHSYRNLSECHFVHHKSHSDWPGIEPVSPRCQAVDWPPEPRYDLGLTTAEMSPVADWKEQARQVHQWLSQVHQDTFSMSAPTAKWCRTEFRHPPATSSSDRVTDTSGMLYIERCAVFVFSHFWCVGAHLCTAWFGGDSGSNADKIMTPCWLVSGYRRFGAYSCLHLQGAARIVLVLRLNVIVTFYNAEL